MQINEATDEPVSKSADSVEQKEAILIVLNEIPNSQNPWA